MSRFRNHTGQNLNSGPGEGEVPWFRWFGFFGLEKVDMMQSSLPEGSPDRRRVAIVGSALAFAAFSVVLLAVSLGAAGGGGGGRGGGGVLQGGRSSLLEAGSLAGGMGGLVIPRQEDIDKVFGADAEAVLAKIGMSMADTQLKSSLDTGCSLMASVCLAEVGKCIAPVDKVEVSEGACECFEKAHKSSISLPMHPGISLRCSVSCVETIFDVFDRYALKSSDGSSSLPCFETIKDMQEREFGNSHGYMHAPDDLDASQLWPVDSQRVIEAGSVLMTAVNSERAELCHTKGLFDGVRVDSAWGSLVSGGEVQFFIEATMGEGPNAVEFSARVTPDEVMGLPAGGYAPLNPTDPGDLMGKYSVYGIKPDPCGDDKLALTHKSAVEAGVSSKHRLSGDFGRLAPRPGVIMDSEARKSRLLNTHSWDTSDFHPPASYDARGKDQIGRMCAASQIGDQKNCASCYAFAAAKIMAYRLCLESNGVYDYEISEQELLDCSTGSCKTGGDVLKTMEQSVQGGDKPSVSTWCDPYTPRQQKCGTICDDGMRLYTKKGAGRTIGYIEIDSMSKEQAAAAIEENVKQYKMELMKGGPVNFVVKAYDEFIKYKGGIYEVRNTGGTSVHAGGHAMTLVGWGEENGIPYWLVQNSWGISWGEDGMGRIRMGVNAAGCEDWGIDGTTMEMPRGCEGTVCENGGEILRDCTCKCRGLWTGDKCDTCPNDCGMGRHKGGGSCACECPPGSSGASCEHFLEASLFAACEKNETATVHVKWGGAQNKGAFAAFYKEGETQTFTLDSSGRTTQMTDVVFEPLCGINQRWANPRWPTACRSFGSVDIKTPAEAGEYGLYVVPYIKDVGTPQPLKDEYKVASFTVLPSGSCSIDSLIAATEKNDERKKWLSGTVQGEAPAAAAVAGAHVATLAEKSIEGLHSRAGWSGGGGKLWIEGVHRGVVWLAGQVSRKACYALPEDVKGVGVHLALFESIGMANDTSFTYVRDGVGAEEQLGNGIGGENATHGCVHLTFQNRMDDSQRSRPHFVVRMYRGMPASGANWTLSDSRLVAQSQPFEIASANLAFATVPSMQVLLGGGRRVTAVIKWNVEPSVIADRNDVIGVYNSDLEQVYWFYTSCICQHDTRGSEPAAKVERATIQFEVEDNHPAGGYHLRYMPRGTRFVGGASTDWIDWDSEFRGGL